MQHEGSLNVALTGAEYDPLKHLPMINPLERRALALKFAIEARVWMNFGGDDPKGVAAAELVVDVAKVFEAYIAGDTDD